MNSYCGESLPWHQRQWQQYVTAVKTGKLGHALLLQGPGGLGKRWFAGRLARHLLCTGDRTEEVACGDCQGCRLTDAGTHPDWHLVAPEEDSKTIKVEQIRDLATGLAMCSHAGGWKLAIVDPADAMNLNAANSLLKTLEEPTPSTLLVLIATSQSGLPATIRSRCQRIRFNLPGFDMAIRWLDEQTVDPTWWRLLRFAGGAPLDALKLAAAGFNELDSSFQQDLGDVIEGCADPLAVAESWEATDPAVCITWLRGVTVDLIRQNWSENGSPESDAVNTLSLQMPGKAPTLTLLFSYLDRLDSAARLLDGPVNKLLVLESLLIPWAWNLRAA